MKTETEFQLYPRTCFRTISILSASMVLASLLTLNGRAQTYTVLHDFSGDGRRPQGLILSGSTLYGMALAGPHIFSIHIDGSGFASFLPPWDGGSAGFSDKVLLSGSTIYGVIMDGGRFGAGMVFRMDTNGSDFAVLKYFGDTNIVNDGRLLSGGLVLSQDTLYGVTAEGGSLGLGTVFKIDTDGSGYDIIKHFSGSDGANPNACLVLSGTTLYGTTQNGGASNQGTAFRVNTNGSGYTVLRSFSWPALQRDLIVSGTTLYGTTLNYDPVEGHAFKMDTDGSNYIEFGWGANKLVLDDNVLYGSTFWVGGSYHGTLFMANTDGGGHSIIKEFNGLDGDGPSGIVVSGRTLYGTTYSGGSGSSGVVFSLSLPIPKITPVNQTVEVGSTAMFTVEFNPASMVGHQWFFNSTNPITALTTNCELVLTNVQFSQAGAYTAVAYGAITSSPAMLSVIAPVERRSVPALGLYGQPGALLSLDYRDSLSPGTVWVSLDQTTLSNAPQFYLDLSEPLPPQRFYRAWQNQTPGLVPALDLHLVPEIQLTGSMGDSVRLDYINVIGPTDAWVTLDTVTLTNTSQVYFDLSSIGQPGRLYRIVPVP